MSFLYPDSEEQGLYGELWNELLLRVSQGSKVLEVGCGNGEMLQALCRRTGCHGVGADPWAPSLEGDNPRFVALGGEEIARLKESFDVIYTAKSLHHMEDVPAFLRASRRLLGEKGVLLIGDWKEGMDRGFGETYHSPKRILGWLEEAGFRFYEVRVRPTHMFVVASDSPTAPMEYEV